MACKVATTHRISCLLDAALSSDERFGRRKLPRSSQGLAPSWWDAASDIERKAYLEAHPNSKYGSQSNSVKDAGINSRDDYHWASAAFHRGKKEALQGERDASPKHGHPDYNYEKDVGLHSQKSWHDEMERRHLAAVKRLEWEKKGVGMGAPDSKPYNSHLNEIRGKYATEEESRKAANKPFGVGHTRYISK